MDALFLDSERIPPSTSFFDLKNWLIYGRAAYRSANNVVFVYEAVPWTYIYSVIDRTYNKELLAEYDWDWLKRAVQANKLQSYE